MVNSGDILHRAFRTAQKSRSSAQCSGGFVSAMAIDIGAGYQFHRLEQVDVQPVGDPVHPGTDQFRDRPQVS